MTAAIEVTGIVIRWPPNPWATRSVPSAHNLTGCRPIRSLTGGTGRASGGPAGSDTTFLLAAADTADGEGVNAPPDSRVSGPGCAAGAAPSSATGARTCGRAGPIESPPRATTFTEATRKAPGTVTFPASIGVHLPGVHRRKTGKLRSNSGFLTFP